MNIVISREKTQLPAGSVVRMLGTWGEYHMQTRSRYFPEVDLFVLVDRILQAASERGTGIALRELRQMYLGFGD